MLQANRFTPPGRKAKLHIWLISIGAVLAGCGEMGHDPDGPIGAYLVLERPDGTRANFYLGGYRSQQDCENVVRYEVKSAEENRNGEFWTNPEFSYGGYQQPGWVKNRVVGSKCEIRSGRAM